MDLTVKHKTTERLGKKHRRKSSGLGLGKYTHRHFTEKELQIANRRMKRYPKSLVIREMQVKTIMRCHYIPFRMAKMKK